MQAARRLYEAGRIAEAAERLLPLREPLGSREDDGLLLLGVCLARLKQVEGAIEVLGDELRRRPDSYEALTWLAVLEKSRRDPRAALEFATRAIELRPDLAEGYGSAGACYLAMRESEPAIDMFRRAAELAPDVAEHAHNLGLSLLMAHRHGEAIAQFRRAISLAPQSPQSYLSLAGAYTLYGMAGDALDCLSQALAAIPDSARSAPLHSAAASAFAMIKNDAAAERHHRRATELSKDARREYAAWLLNQGRFSESERLFSAMAADGSDPAYAYYGMMQTRKLTPDDAPFVEAMRRLPETQRLPAGSRMYLSYALGRAEEQIGHYREAMSHFDDANELAFALNHAGHPIDPDTFASEREQILRLDERLRIDGTLGSNTYRPVFIIGMIRSGTTLLDQIVSSHPEVASAGELRFWIEETLRLAAQTEAPTPRQLTALADSYAGYVRVLTGAEGRFTDKMPLNFAYAGVIRAAVPGAKFLHIRRHPVDTCLSIYTTYFGKGALFAYRRAHIVAYYLEYLRTMEHWRTTLPEDSLLEVQYEDLVTDPEPVVQRVLEFCGLPWDEACLRPERNTSAINTPSRWQARQPVYRTSVDRWKRYEPWLGEFAKLLGS